MKAKETHLFVENALPGPGIATTANVQLAELIRVEC
jgi:hypothetical protein